jgi:hypothetical protein
VLLALLITIGAGTLSRYAHCPQKALKHAAIWLAIAVFLAAIAVYFPAVMPQW